MISVAAMEKSFKCHSCSEGFNSLKKLNVHLNLQHEGVDDRKKKKIKCNVCGYGFRNGQDLIRHMRTHTGERPFKCQVSGCGMAFKEESTLNNHFKSKHTDDRPYKCDFSGCRHTTKTSQSLYHHKKVHSDERPFACPKSGCSFRAKFTSHIKLHVNGVHSETKSFSCGQCDYKTAWGGHLKRHMLCHSSKRDFWCSHPQCAESFKCSSDLKRHFRNRHGEKNILCDLPGCGGKFSTAKALWDHKSSVHANKKHTCPNPECNYRTNKPSALASHMVVHEGVNANIPCSIDGCEYKGKHNLVYLNHMRSHKTLLACPVSTCGRHLTTKESLKEHIKFHNPSGRAFQCPLCLKHYRKLFELQRHCVVHTNEKPFQCGQCEFAAATQTRVKTHISSVHAAIAFPFIVHLLDDRECLRCKVTLPSAEFVIHCMRHVDPVLIA